MGADELGVGIWIVMGIYMLLLVLIGVAGYFKKDEDSVSDHFLAGGGLGKVVIFMTMFSTAYSGYVLVGLPGDTYRNGYSSVQWIGGTTSISAGMILFGIMIHRQAKKGSYVSPLDYIKERYQNNYLFASTWIASFIPLIIYIFAQCKAMGETTEGLTNGEISAVWGATALSVVMLLYEILGGMRSVAWTDVLQGVLLIVGFSALLIISVSEIGLNDIAEKIVSNKTKLTTVPTTIEQLSMASFSMKFIFSPFYYHILQRLMAAKDEKTLQFTLSFFPWTGLVCLSSIVLGLFSISQFDLPDSESDQVFSLVLKYILHKGGIYYWIVAILLAASVASLMSTGDSGLMAISSLISWDLLKGHIWKNATEKQILIVSKLCSAIILTICVILAVTVNINLKTVLNLQFNLMMQVGPSFIIGIQFPNIKASPVLFGQCLGIFTTVCLVAADVSPLGIEAGIYGMILNLLGILISHQLMIRMEGDRNSGELVDLNDVSHDLGSTDLLIKMKEPFQYWWIWALYFLILIVSIPFYRQVGYQDAFVLGFPVWALVSLLCYLVACFGLTIVCYLFWDTSYNHSAPVELNIESLESLYISSK
eukprot:TRINITY_DN7426_c0_g1_i1.p1 TRINITY_DN7426_c0_g1~~TRINITY_DN7426_c0_g1_i1.p1  ORF type:complete len:593 (+),score=75.26 TRINITY_DN7426_c0_g1_i1:378-2156(+)